MKTVSFNYVFRYIVPERNYPILVTIQSCSFDLIKLIRMVHSRRLWTESEEVFKFQIMITKDYILCTRFIRMQLASVLVIHTSPLRWVRVSLETLLCTPHVHECVCWDRGSRQVLHISDDWPYKRVYSIENIFTSSVPTGVVN